MANSIKNTIINWTVAQTPTVQSNEIFTNTINLSNDDDTMNTTIDGSGIVTPNLTTFTINNGDLKFEDEQIVINDKILTFDGEDVVIPENTIAIDQTFDATSTNVLSGVAVAEALKTIPLAWTKNDGDTPPTSYGPGGLAIGPKAKVTETSALAVGYNAKASYANTALGADASAFGGTVYWSVAIGAGAHAYESQSVVVGDGANSHNAYTCAIGRSSLVQGGSYSIALGGKAKVYKSGAIALGYNAKVNDAGAAVISALDTQGKSQTLFYIIGKNTPLANTYEDGMACLGYVVKAEDGTILECGTRKLSELLTNNTNFAPTSLDPDAPEPTPFMPAGITDPIEWAEEITTEI